MTLRKAIATKTLYLLVASLGKFAFIAACDHAIDHLCLEMVDGTDIAKCRHRTAQLVRITG